MVPGPEVGAVVAGDVGDVDVVDEVTAGAHAAPNAASAATASTPNRRLMSGRVPTHGPGSPVACRHGRP